MWGLKKIYLDDGLCIKFVGKYSFFYGSEVFLFGEVIWYVEFFDGWFLWGLVRFIVGYCFVDWFEEWGGGEKVKIIKSVVIC